ncbi:MAG: hypothetical protein RL557_403 [archaeon]|jgi:hypothetical protein
MDILDQLDSIARHEGENQYKNRAFVAFAYKQLRKRELPISSLELDAFSLTCCETLEDIPFWVDLHNEMKQLKETHPDKDYRFQMFFLHERPQQTLPTSRKSTEERGILYVSGGVSSGYWDNDMHSVDALGEAMITTSAKHTEVPFWAFANYPFEGMDFKKGRIPLEKIQGKIEALL